MPECTVRRSFQHPRVRSGSRPHASRSAETPRRPWRQVGGMIVVERPRTVKPRLVESRQGVPARTAPDRQSKARGVRDSAPSPVPTSGSVARAAW